MDVSGKSVVVGGGSGNLGSAIVADLLKRGARVASVDARPPISPIDDASFFFIQTDLADEASVTAALDAVVARSGPIAALVNCAGTIHSEPLVNLMDPENRRHRLTTWDAVVRSNLTATFVLGAHVAERMAASRTKGVIVNFSSVAAAGNAGQSAYAAAKAGVEALTAVWARELGLLGIRVVAIAPGFVDTASTRDAVSEEALTELKRRTPLRRLAKPQEIADAVAFAIANDFITGRTIAIDGGLSI